MKNALADHAGEHFKIATYQALIRAAQEVGEYSIVHRLEVILAQEEAMADFLPYNSPPRWLSWRRTRPR